MYGPFALALESKLESVENEIIVCRPLLQPNIETTDRPHFWTQFSQSIQKGNHPLKTELRVFHQSQRAWNGISFPITLTTQQRPSLQFKETHQLLSFYDCKGMGEAQHRLLARLIEKISPLR